MLKRTRLVSILATWVMLILITSSASATIVTVSQYHPKQVLQVDTENPIAWNTIWSGSDYPTGITFDTSGTAYMGRRLERIQKADSPYSSWTNLTTSTSEKWQCLTLGSDGYLYGANDKGIDKVDVSDGTYTRILSVDSNMSNPTGLAFNSAGELFVSSYGTDSVLRYVYSGGAWGLEQTYTTATLDNPMQLALDSQENLYVASRGSHEVIKINPSDGTSSVFATKSAWSSSLAGVAIDPETGDVYASSYNAQEIYVFNSDGTDKTQLTMPTIDPEPSGYGGYLTIVPEPTTMALLAAGGALALLRRRKIG